MPQILVYHMTGQLPQPPYTAFFWNVFGQPDPTGAQSGYGAGYLINVEIVYASIDGSPIDPVSGQVGGDLTGYLPNPYVSGLQGKPISTTAPTSGQVLQYNGTTYVPVTPTFPSDNVGGDLSGILPNPTVVGIQGQAISASAPSFGQSLTWTGSQWGGVSPGGDVTGSSIASITVAKLQGSAVSASPPISGAPLAWNGSAWVATSLSGDITGSIGSNTVSNLQGTPLNVPGPITTGDIIAYDGVRWAKTTPSIPITTSATSSPTANTIVLRDGNGATQFASTANNSLTIGAGLLASITNTAFGLAQTARSTDAATNDILMETQAPFASATGTNRLPGDFVINIPLAAGALATTNSGNVYFSFDGNPMVSIYQIPSTGIGAIEFPNNGTILNVTSVTSGTLSMFINADLNLYGTPVLISSTGNIDVQAENLIDINAGGGITIDDPNGFGLSLVSSGATRFSADATGIGFFATAPIAKPTVTGSKGANAALASLLTALANLGLVTDSSS